MGDKMYAHLDIMYAHIDIRGFYAACEQYMNPEHRGKAVAVYNESFFGKRKIIAVSKEAKKLDIIRDSSVEDAERAGVTLIKSRLEEYRRIASELYQICSEHVGNEGCRISTPHIDDIVIEVDGLKKAIGLSREVEKLYNELGFDLAIGISFNRDYAHIATQRSKKYGLIYFGRGFARKVIYKNPVIQFPQIGYKRAKKLNRLGIHTIEDIAEMPLYLIQSVLGKKRGKKIHDSVKGIDVSEGQMVMFG